MHTVCAHKIYIYTPTAPASDCYPFLVYLVIHSLWFTSSALIQGVTWGTWSLHLFIRQKWFLIQLYWPHSSVFIYTLTLRATSTKEYSKAYQILETFITLYIYIFSCYYYGNLFCKGDGLLGVYVNSRLMFWGKELLSQIESMQVKDAMLIE